MHRFKLLPFVLALMSMALARAQDRHPTKDFMVVLREVEAVNKATFSYAPTGPNTATLPSGEKVTLESAWFDLIGDMHVRFVIDGETSMRNLTKKEFVE